MIKYFKGDVTAGPERALVHGCNCQGVMGSGVALAVREKWPEAYDVYRLDALIPGCFSTVEVLGGKLIGNLYTQEFYGRDGKRYADPHAIRVSLDSFCFYFRNWVSVLFDDLPAIAMPKIGCGLGGLSWENDVEPIARSISTYHRIDFHVYDNSGKEDWK